MAKTAHGKSSVAGRKAGTGRRTQAERREQSRQAVLDSALKVFGEKGYADTTLDDIAADCGLTIRPIYHYFGNKKLLFAAVNEYLEQRIVDALRVDEAGVGMEENWRAYLDLCDDPAFRRIVLIDSPTVLGRERWADSAVSRRARQSLQGLSGRGKSGQFRGELLRRVLMASLAEAALCVGEAEDVPAAKKEAARLMNRVFSALVE